MSDHTVIVVGLKKEELKYNKQLLYHSGYGYEDGEVWAYKLKAKGANFFQKEIDKSLVEFEDRGSIYGIAVVGTWHGAIDLEEISNLIEEAKQVFKKITNQTGKVYLIGEQT